MKNTSSRTLKDSISVGDSVEVTIESLSYHGGRGVGRLDSAVIFIPDTAPGDRVLTRVVAVKPRFLEGELVEVLAPSVHRRSPPCPVFGRCGGCVWQHISYDMQVEQKEKILRDSLRKIATRQSFEWKPFLRAPNEFYYRNRIQLHRVSGPIGFFARRTRDVVPVSKCLIAEPQLNEALSALSSVDFAGDSRLELALTEALDVHVSAGPRNPETALFSQVNREQNDRMRATLKSMIDPRASWAFDLFAGSGNLTEPLVEALPGRPIMAIELSRHAVERGMKRGLPVEFIAGDVGRVLKRREVNAGRGSIVTDPPRTGCDQLVIDEMARHRPSQIVYVSCNPATFARDAERLLNRGFSLVSVQGLDMFPQTEHVELIAEFRAAT